MSLDVVQKIADAVFYDGYHPPPDLALHHQMLSRFGVTAPRVYQDAGGIYPWFVQTECLVEPGNMPLLSVRIRCLRIQSRRVQTPHFETFRDVDAIEVDGKPYATGDEAQERTFNLDGLSLSGLHIEHTIPLEMHGGREEQILRDRDGTVTGRLLLQRRPVSILVRLHVLPMGRVHKVRIRLENWSRWHDITSDHASALRRSLLSAHMLLQVRDGSFLSLLEPPQWAREAAASCDNQHTFPVLAGGRGKRDVMLSSPVVLDDYPTSTGERAPHVDERAWDATADLMDRVHEAIRSFAAGDAMAEQPQLKGRD